MNRRYGEQIGTSESLPPRAIRISARHVVLGAMASLDWKPLHHDRDAAPAQGLPDIILNTPSQIGWFSGYVTAWTGPAARLARWRLKMRTPVCPGDELLLSGSAHSTGVDPHGHHWVEFILKLERSTEAASTARMLYAMPSFAGCPGPWQLDPEDWHPPRFSTKN
jgi:hypothetical protein